MEEDEWEKSDGEEGWKDLYSHTRSLNVLLCY